MTTNHWDHVWWLGGSPCSGKSSAAAILAERHGMRVYSCDAAFDDHARRAPEGSRLRGLLGADLGRLFSRPPGELARLELAAYATEFPLILED
ncbi:MAG TPA: hypothetical protein VHN99_05310, partial [Deinococcales bacterium]|nr:hypothetical protein [Deinococcales bacterium]